MAALTCIIVIFNDEARLESCLESVDFCDEVIVVDIGSLDGSREIATRRGARILDHAWVPIGERVLPDVMPVATNDWILRVDPDEVFPATMCGPLSALITSSASIGAISLPHQYYFLGEPLTTTVWGGLNFITRVFHRNRVDVTGDVHQALLVRQGYDTVRLEDFSAGSIQHFWVDSWTSLFEKHRRYIPLEAAAAIRRGDIFSWRKATLVTYRALWLCLLSRRGILGGWRGIFLSFFYTWYVMMSQLCLRQQARYTR